MATRATRAASYGSAVTGYLRKYAFQPRYGREAQLTLRTADGVVLTGAHLAGPPDACASIVLVHGLAHSSRTPRVHTFAHLLARRAHVVVPNLRGHSTSGGACTLGFSEPLDVAAAVDAAKMAHPELPVVTVGVSLGAAAVALHAGTYGGVAGVVAVSGPAWSGTWDSVGTARVRRFMSSPVRRRFLALAMRTRIDRHCQPVPDAQDVVGAIAPAFMVIVHDPADHYFGVEHPRALYEWARPPKSLWLVERAGHGSDLLTPEFADRLLGEVERRTCRPPGSPGEAVSDPPR